MVRTTTDSNGAVERYEQSTYADGTNWYERRTTAPSSASAARSGSAVISPPPDRVLPESLRRGNQSATSVITQDGGESTGVAVPAARFQPRTASSFDGEPAGRNNYSSAPASGPSTPTSPTGPSRISATRDCGGLSVTSTPRWSRSGTRTDDTAATDGCPVRTSSPAW